MQKEMSRHWLRLGLVATQVDYAIQSHPIIGLLPVLALGGKQGPNKLLLIFSL
jgi:hypothetical protein